MRSKSSINEKVIDLNRPHTCEFCHKSFVQESTLVSHMCEPKRRHNLKQSPQVQQAYVIYTQISQQLNPRSKKLVPTYQEFSHSHMWSQLVRFVSWCEEQLVQEPEQFVRWLMQQHVKLDAWCDRKQYDEFLTVLLLSEPAEQALCRSLKTMHEWHINTQKPFTEFFACVNTHQCVSWISQGRMSAWLLYNCESAEKLFVRCTPEQLMHIAHHAPITKWKVKFLRLTSEVTHIKLTLAQAGL
jgi:hypothetical protein